MWLSEIVKWKEEQREKQKAFLFLWSNKLAVLNSDWNLPYAPPTQFYPERRSVIKIYYDFDLW